MTAGQVSMASGCDRGRVTVNSGCNSEPGYVLIDLNQFGRKSSKFPRR